MSNALDDIFESRRWKGKYKITYCEMCDSASIVCPICNSGSCSCGGCPECLEDMREYSATCKDRVQNYLTEEEKKIFEKARRIKQHMMDSLRDGETKINFKERAATGKFSQTEREMFKDFI